LGEFPGVILLGDWGIVRNRLLIPMPDTSYFTTSRLQRSAVMICVSDTEVKHNTRSRTDRHITLPYIIVINNFKEKNFNQFTRVKRNRKGEFSVDV